MGMPGENVFVFKDGNQFYYYERLSYSEGTFEWIDEKQIKLTSKKMGFDIPYKETRCYRDLSGKIVIFKRNNLLFEGFILKHVKKGIQDETRTMGKL